MSRMLASDEKAKKLSKKLEQHTFNGDDGEEYSESTFGGIHDYMRRKRVKLQNRDAKLRSEYARAEAAKIFRGCVITVLGYTVPNSSIIHQLTIKHGGVYLQFLEGKTNITHIIATNLPANKKKEFARYKVVRPEWMIESIREGMLLDWTKHRVITGSAGQAILGFSTGGGPAIVKGKAPGVNPHKTPTSDLKAQALGLVRLPPPAKLTQTKDEIPASDDEEFGSNLLSSQSGCGLANDVFPSHQPNRGMVYSSIDSDLNPPPSRQVDKAYKSTEDEDEFADEVSLVGKRSFQDMRQSVMKDDVPWNESFDATVSFLEEIEQSAKKAIPNPPAKAAPISVTEFEPLPPPPSGVVNGVEVYEVELILDHKIFPKNAKPKNKRGKKRYLVKWKGYGEKDATWEWEDTLREDLGSDALGEMVEDYRMANGIDSSAPTQKSTPKQSQKKLTQTSSSKLRISEVTEKELEKPEEERYIPPRNSQLEVRSSPAKPALKSFEIIIPESFSTFAPSQETVADGPAPEPKRPKLEHSSESARNVVSETVAKQAAVDKEDFFLPDHEKIPPATNTYSLCEVPDSFSSFHVSQMSDFSESEQTSATVTQAKTTPITTPAPTDTMGSSSKKRAGIMSDPKDRNKRARSVEQIVSPSFRRAVARATGLVEVHPPVNASRDDAEVHVPSSPPIPPVQAQSPNVTEQLIETLNIPENLEEIATNLEDDFIPSSPPMIPGSPKTLVKAHDLGEEPYPEYEIPSSPPMVPGWDQIIRESQYVNSIEKLRPAENLQKGARLEEETIPSSFAPPSSSPKKSSPPGNKRKRSPSSQRPLTGEPETAEEFNAILLSNPRVRDASVLNPDFLTKYFQESRLHHLSTWKAEIRARLQKLARASSRRPGSRIKSRRYVMHVDFDCFFAAVAIKDRPELKNKPVAITHGNSETSTSSEIASCNYVARGFGVKNGSWLSSALQLCPDLVCLGYEFGKYEVASEAFYKVILAVRGERVQAVSIDEVLIDITNKVCDEHIEDAEREEARAKAIATRVREECLRQSGCEVSVGIGQNIFIAKLALRKAKPAGQCLITAAETEMFLEDVNVASFPGVGRHTTVKIQEKFGCDVVRELRMVSKERLKDALGPKTGERIYELCRGIDNTQVGDDQTPRQSISADVTWGVRFTNNGQVEEFVHRLAKEVQRRLRAEGVIGANLTAKISRRARDAPFETEKFLGCGRTETTNKSFTFKIPTADADLIGTKAVELLRACHISPGELRGIGLTMKALENDKKDLGGQKTLGFEKDVMQPVVQQKPKLPPIARPEPRPAQQMRIKAYVKPKVTTLMDVFAKKTAAKKQVQIQTNAASAAKKELQKELNELVPEAPLAQKFDPTPIKPPNLVEPFNKPDLFAKPDPVTPRKLLTQNTEESNTSKKTPAQPQMTAEHLSELPAVLRNIVLRTQFTRSTTTPQRGQNMPPLDPTPEKAPITPNDSFTPFPSTQFDPTPQAPAATPTPNNAFTPFPSTQWDATPERPAISPKSALTPFQATQLDVTPVKPAITANNALSPFQATQFDIPSASQIDPSVWDSLGTPIREAILKQQRIKEWAKEHAEAEAEAEAEAGPSEPKEPEPDLEEPPNSQYDIDIWNELPQEVRAEQRAEWEAERQAAIDYNKNPTWMSPGKGKQPAPFPPQDIPKAKGKNTMANFIPGFVSKYAAINPTVTGKGKGVNRKNALVRRVYDTHGKEVTPWIFTEAGLDPGVFFQLDTQSKFAEVQRCVREREKKHDASQAVRNKAAALEYRKENAVHVPVKRRRPAWINSALPDGMPVLSTDMNGLKSGIRAWVRKEYPEDDDVEEWYLFLKDMILIERCLAKAVGLVRHLLIMAGEKPGWGELCDGTINAINEAAALKGLPPVEF